MPKIEFAGQTIECLKGANLRMVLLRARLPPYTKIARAIHCHGNGTCGTCDVRVEGPVTEPTPARFAACDFHPTHRIRGFDWPASAMY
jgi:ferredoxin